MPIYHYNLEPLPPNSRSQKYRKQRPWNRFRGIARELTDSFLRIDAMGLSKQVSYSVVFALVPAMFVLVAMSTLIENLTNVPVNEELREFVLEHVPDAAQPILLNAIDQAITNTSVLTASISGLIALVIAIWAGMGGVNTLVEAINRAYGVRNTRSWPQKRLFSFLMTFVLAGMIVLTVLAVFFSGKTIDRLTAWFGPSGFLGFSGEAVQGFLIFSTTFLVLLILYRFSPSVDQHLRWSVPGALLITLAWFGLLSVSGYIARRLSFDTVFGAAGGFLLLLYVLNLAALLLIVGAVINGVLGNRYDMRRKADLAAHPRKIRYVQSGQEILPDPFQFPVSKSTFTRFLPRSRS
jgi:membrane protein